MERVYWRGYPRKQEGGSEESEAGKKGKPIGCVVEVAAMVTRDLIPLGPSKKGTQCLPVYST